MSNTNIKFMVCVGWVERLYHISYILQRIPVMTWRHCTFLQRDSGLRLYAVLAQTEELYKLYFTAAENNVIEPNLEKVQSFSRGSYRASLRWVLKMIVNLNMFPDLYTSSHYSKIPIVLMNCFSVCCMKESGRAPSILRRQSSLGKK